MHYPFPSPKCQQTPVSAHKLTQSPNYDMEMAWDII